MKNSDLKAQRHEAIRHIVNTQAIYTQADLTAALAQAGFKTAQATISRDIHELHMIKERTPQGQKYALPKRDEDLHPMSRIFRDGTVSIEAAGNMLVIRTLSGMAMAVALALDNMNLPEILGTIAGDDAVMCVVTSESHAADLVEKLAP